MLVASWWTVYHTKNELLFDTCVNNKLPYGAKFDEFEFDKFPAICQYFPY